MIWKRITLEDKEWMSELYAKENRKGCENCFGNNYIWSQVYQVEVLKECDCILFKSGVGEQIRYSFPVGMGDKKKAIELLLEDAQSQGRVFRMRGLVAEDVEFMKRCFPDLFSYQSDRDWYDYIYSVEKMSSLSGKKLHGKRNHIARFKENHNWRYEKMSTENKIDCLKMTEKWCELQRDKWNDDMEDEFGAVKTAIENFEALDFIGGVLYVEDEIVAYTIGEKLCDDTMVIHIEKAYANIQGAYPMINQQFILHECQDYTYVNREEDTGAEGLRKAKLSYYPDILLEKFEAVLL